MCGIVGVIDKTELPRNMEPKIREAMELQHHRGPDESGLAEFPYAIFAHLRLSIIDLAGGSQPMYTADGRYCIIFNGEIYNFAVVKLELEARGIRFSTHSDTEVLLYAYREFGPACLDKLNGMFAFAILDTQQREVFLARDRLGKKPLYYCLEDGRLLFASELKGLRPLLGRSPELDHTAFDCYLANRYVASPLTLLRGVRKLPPGYFGLWKDGDLKLHRYWDIPTGQEMAIDPVEAGRELYTLLSDSVRLRMIADVPLGVFLSGGLDSTIITHLMHEQRGTGIQTFSIASTGGGQWDERKFADLAALHYGTNHHEMVLDPSGFMSSMETMAWQVDDLVADPASILLYHVSKLAREHVTVALSGEGSDELFAGYNYSSDLESWDRQRRFNSLPPFLPALAGGLLPKSASLARYRALYRKSMQDFACLSKDYFGTTGDAAFRRGFFKAEFAKNFGLSNSVFTGEFHAESKARDMFSHLLYMDSKVWLPDNLLTKADRMSMATSLELRVPFLDYRVVEFCSKLPMKYKMRPLGKSGWEVKALLKDVFRGKIPQQILERKKQGFHTNFVGILSTPTGKSFMRNALLDSESRYLFDESKLVSAIDRLGPEDKKLGQFLFSLVLFTFWYRRFLGKA